MYISSFKDVRKFILTNTTIEILAELGLGGVFANVQADVVAYTLKNTKTIGKGTYLDFKKYKNHTNKPLIFADAYADLLSNRPNKHNYTLPQEKLKIIEGWPFIYWISDG